MVSPLCTTDRAQEGLQRQVRTARRGLWADAYPEAQWEFRRPAQPALLF